MGPRRIIEQPDDLAAIVDPIGHGCRGAGDIERDERGAVCEKAMQPRSTSEHPDDLALVVDAKSLGVWAPGTSNVVNVSPSFRNPWSVPAASLNYPTIWPLLLIP